MSYHRERKLAGVGAIDAATRPTRSAPAPSFSNPRWSYYTGRAGLGRIMEERPTRPPPQGGGSGRIDTAPPVTRNQTPPIINPCIANPASCGIVPPVIIIPPPGGSPMPLPDPLPPPLPPPPPPVTKPPPILPSCTPPYVMVGTHCELVSQVPPGGTQTPPIGGGGGLPPIVEIPPFETDDYTITPPAAPPAKTPIVPILLIGGGVALGLALILRKH
jgi:hypothetical protein